MGEGSKRQASYQDKRNVTNKAYLIEAIIRHRIQDSIFYKQYLYLTNEATIIPIIIDQVKYIGGTDANGRPSPFLCCLLRLLELDPSQDILNIYQNQLNYQEFKYLTSIVLIYYRLTLNNHMVYNLLDDYYQDYRKLLFKLKVPEFDDKNLPIKYRLTYMDEWVDDLLTKERVIDIQLPRLLPRLHFLQKNLVKPRQYHVDLDNENTNQQENTIDSNSDYQSDSD